MRNFRGLFVGLTTIDIQYLVDEFPLPNIKIKSEQPDILVGGPAVNAAVAFAKLNGNATLISAVGNNSFSKFVADDFQNAKVDLIDLMHEKDFSPVLATVVTSGKNGERNIFTHNPKSVYPKVKPKELFEELTPEIVMLDGFYPEISIQCAQLARQKNIPVVLDCGSWKPQFDELLNFADIAICSENFFPQNAVNSQQVFSFLKEKNVEYCAISRGEKPILFYNKKRIGEIEVKQHQVVDSLGAGDILHGAFCYYYIHDNNFEKALEKASDIATFSCQFKGTREWLNFLQQVLF